MKKNKYIHITDEHNTRAASIVVPEILKMYKAESVADIGCGLGTWLKVFSDSGVNRIQGFDGMHLDLKKIVIPKNKIILCDLEQEIKSETIYDLAISLEVAEHITKKNAEVFVKSLCNLSQTIIFSAAIPNQGGQNHLNEQWPEYWQKIFYKHGYTMHDVLRMKFWDIEEVDYWYRQNMFLVTGPESPYFIKENKHLTRLVHPKLLEIYSDIYQKSISGKLGKIRAMKTLIKSFSH